MKFTYFLKCSNVVFFCLCLGNLKAQNFAEMTSDKKVLGGSWFHSAEMCKIGQEIAHNPDEPTFWLGFRCVVRVK